MRLFNALSGKKERIEGAEKRISIYVCGITPYDTTHLGHGFTYATFDVLIRYLKTVGYQVQYAQNVTDIDDDILKRAKRDNLDWRELGDRWTRHFIDDNQALNLCPPEYFPRATEVVGEIIDNVEKLLTRGVAYEDSGNVYFEIKKDSRFGQLSGLKYAEMLPIANERGNFPDDVLKRDPLDFVLWQTSDADEPGWDSPWGRGRPGWHIECSTMSSKFLGLPLDIHGGGADLMFPHHECEISQAEYASSTQPFSRFWMHVAMVHYQGEKMSKSLGNLIMVRDLLNEGFDPDAIRLLFAGYHYREAWTYQRAALLAAAELAKKLMAAAAADSGSKKHLDIKQHQDEFEMAMKDDLNTPLALNSLIDLADSIFQGADDKWDIEDAQTLLKRQSAVFGLRLGHGQPEKEVVDGWNGHRLNFI